MTILNSYIEPPNLFSSWVIAIIATMLVGGIAGAIVASLSTSDAVLIFISIGAGALCLFIFLFCGYSNLSDYVKANEKEIVEAIIDSETSFTEVYNKYKIIDQRGEIYVLELKEGDE